MPKEAAVTEAENTREEVERVLGVWKSRLHLAHWRTKIDWDTDSENEAEFDRTNYYDEGTLKLCSEWKGWDAQKLNEVMVHELLHLLMRDMEEAAKAVKDQLSAPAWELYHDRLNHEIEGVIDRLAVILAAASGNA